MARRSPNNPRYQKGGDVGKTRRSAASAKPKRAAGDSSSDSSKKSSKKKGKRKGLFASVPMTPEYRSWRKMWLGVLAAAIIFSVLAWWRQQTLLGNLALALAYVCIFTAFYIDFFRLRRLRKAAIEADKDRKARKSGKPDKNGKGDKDDKDA